MSSPHPRNGSLVFGNSFSLLRSPSSSAPSKDSRPFWRSIRSQFQETSLESQTTLTKMLSAPRSRHDQEHVDWVRAQKILSSSLVVNSNTTRSAVSLAAHEPCGTTLITSRSLAMIDEPSWRTRYISIYGESLRQEVLKRHLIITYVTTDLQLADPLTKPTSIKINVHLLPLLGLISCNHIISLALQEEGDESAWSTALYSAADLLRRVLYALLTTNIRLNLKN